MKKVDRFDKRVRQSNFKQFLSQMNTQIEKMTKFQTYEKEGFYSHFTKEFDKSE